MRSPVIVNMIAGVGFYIYSQHNISYDYVIFQQEFFHTITILIVNMCFE